jgi:hypothetical protein
MLLLLLLLLLIICGSPRGGGVGKMGKEDVSELVCGSPC